MGVSCFQGTPKEVFLVLPTCWCPLSMHGEIAGKPKVEKQNEKSVCQIRLSRRTRETQVFKLPLKVSHSGTTLLEVAMKPVQQVFLAFFFFASASAAGLTSTTTTARGAATLEATKVNTTEPVAPKTKETTNSTAPTANSSEIISNTIASNSTNEAPVDKTTQTSKTTNSNSIAPVAEPTSSNATNSNSPNEATSTPPPTTTTPMPCTATRSSSSPALAFFAGVFMVVLLEVLVFALMRWYQRRKFLRYHNFSSNVGDSFSVS